MITLKSISPETQIDEILLGTNPKINDSIKEKENYYVKIY
jgi:hypothetical protein